MAKRTLRSIPEFKKLKADLKKAKRKIEKSVPKPKGAKPSAVARKAHKRAQGLIKRLRKAYFALGNIEGF
jgi:hypothetical protein